MPRAIAPCRTMPRDKTKPPRRFRSHHVRPGKPRPPAESNRVLLYGLHAVEAALANPNRAIGRLLATENAARRLDKALQARRVRAEAALPRRLDRLVGPDAVH